MKKKIIFVSDIDGTLISDGNELSKTSKRILKELYSKGIQIYFATGRDYKKLNDVLGDIEFKYSAICCNGSEIYDEESNVLNKNYLDNEKCETIEYSANGRPLVTVEKSTQYAGQVHLTKKLNTVGSPQLI